MLEKTQYINKKWKHSENLSGVCDVLIFHGAKLLCTVMVIIECTHQFLGRVLRAVAAAKWFSTWINKQRQGCKYPSKVAVLSGELERLVAKFSYLDKSARDWSGNTVLALLLPRWTWGVSWNFFIFRQKYPACSGNTVLTLLLPWIWDFT